MGKGVICSVVAVVGLIAACAPVPVKLSGEVDINVNTRKKDAAVSPVKPFTNATIERVVGAADKCPKLGASLVNSEVSDRTKICYYITEQEK
jgi:hypothetical protein